MKKKALQLRVVGKLKLKAISTRVGLSVRVVSKLHRQWITEPAKVVESFSARIQEPAVDTRAVSDAIRDSAMQKQAYFRSQQELTSYLKDRGLLPRSAKLKQAMSLLRSRVSVRKLKAKLTSKQGWTPLELDAKRLISILIHTAFTGGGRLLIFDTVSFQMCTLSPYLYSVKGVRPRLTRSPNSAFLHVNMLINEEGIVGYTISKGTLEREQIMYTIVGILSQHFEQVRCSKIPSYVLLDNSPLHHEKDLNRIGRALNCTFVYNVPRSPQQNPIEWVFALLKSRWRNYAVGKTTLSPSDLATVIDGISKDSITRTIEHALASLNN